MRFTIFREDSSDEDEKRYSSFVDLEAFEESDDETPLGFTGAEKGLELNPAPEDRSHVKPWDPSENFFSFI